MMKTEEFLNVIKGSPNSNILFVLPNGEQVPAHYHITEIGVNSRVFLDCGGKRHETVSCVLQLWLADDVDHRLKASKLITIFERSGDLITDRTVPIEIEHEAPILSQFTVERSLVKQGEIFLHLAQKHTDCLAKDICVPNFSLPPLPGQEGCAPGSGCC